METFSKGARGFVSRTCGRGELVKMFLSGRKGDGGIGGKPRGIFPDWSISDSLPPQSWICGMKTWVYPPRYHQVYLICFLKRVLMNGESPSVIGTIGKIFGLVS